jgi:chromosomal replication initiation ATPase DnaA
MMQLILDLGHRSASGQADFLVAPSNATAVGWIDRWPDWPAPALVLHGPPGCGKSHLAAIWRARAAVPLIAAPALTVETVPALLGAAIGAVVDEADGAAERPLLHLYNLVAERRGHLLLLADKPPARWKIRLADLRSRLRAAPAVAMLPPDDALLGGVLVKLFADRQVTVGQEVILFLLSRMERSFDAARRLVAALDGEALAQGRAITVPLARGVLERLASDQSSSPSEGDRSPGVT